MRENETLESEKKYGWAKFFGVFLFYVLILNGFLLIFEMFFSDKPFYPQDLEDFFDRELLFTVLSAFVLTLIDRLIFSFRAK